MIKILNEKKGEQGDKIYQILVSPKAMITFGYIVESLEGWAFHTIIDKKQSILHLEVIKDYVNDFDEILKEKMIPQLYGDD